MKKIIFLFLFISSFSFAGEMLCTITEMYDGQKAEQEILVNLAHENPHGSLVDLELKNYTQYKGFVGVVKGVAVLHLYNEETNIAFTAHGNIMGGDHALLQLIFPSTNINELNGLIIYCVLKK